MDFLPEPDFNPQILPAGAIESGDTDYVDDLWNPIAAFVSNGVNTRLTFPNVTGGNNVSAGEWFRQQGTNAASHMLLSHVSVFANRMWQFLVQDGVNVGKFGAQFWDASDNVRTSVSVDEGINDGEWYWLSYSMNPSLGIIDLYKNGLVVDYATQNAGTATSMRSSAQLLELGRDASVADHAFADLTRPAIWDNEYLSAAKHLEWYNLELSKIGEGFDSNRANYYHLLT